MTPGLVSQVTASTVRVSGVACGSRLQGSGFSPGPDTIVTNAFGHALQARGMLTSPSAARYIVTGEVLDLYCQMLVRPYGYARLRVSVLEAGSGQIIFSRVYTGERQGSAFVPGSGSPVGELRQLTSGALQDAVDRALDDRDLRMSLDGGAGGGGYDLNPGGGNPSPRFVPGML